jgi:hypothetical protein
MEDALKQLEALLQARLPSAALERVAAIDAWGETQGPFVQVLLTSDRWMCVVCVLTHPIRFDSHPGIPHAGTLAVLVLCLVVLLASVALLSGQCVEQPPRSVPICMPPLTIPTQPNFHRRRHLQRREQRGCQRAEGRARGEGGAGAACGAVRWRQDGDLPPGASIHMDAGNEAPVCGMSVC